MNPVELVQGNSGVVLGLPHTGTAVPDAIAARLTARGAQLIDTDWHVDRLYAGLLPGASTVRATFHRYVVDANRDPAGISLYPGQNTTELVPTTDFDGQPLWNEPPSAAQIAQRVADFHAPYHAALTAELARVRALHGTVVLFDCHSIRSVIPHLFDGRLPDLNIGTDGGSTCSAAIERCVATACESASDYTWVLNGRFRGGWTTRHYGQPDEGVHAVQLELAQSTYLVDEAAPFDYDPVKADRLRSLLGELLATLAARVSSTQGAPGTSSPTDENRNE